MASDLAPWEIDVNGDGTVSPIDALIVINYLNRSSYGGGSRLAEPRPTEFTPIVPEGGKIQLEVPDGTRLRAPLPEHVDVLLQENILTVTQKPNTFGSDTILLGDGTRNSAIPVIVKPGPGPHAPMAVADQAVFEPEFPVDIPVLANDTDVDGDTLELIAADQAANGSVTWQNGVVTYQPFPGFAGTDRFAYTVRDPGGLEAVGTVTVVASTSPDAPHFLGPEIRRDEAAVAAMSVINAVPGTFTASRFSDVSTQSWAFIAIEEAHARACFANGFAAGTSYAPARTITVGEMALLVVNTLQLPGEDFVSAAVAAGIIDPTEDLARKASAKRFWMSWARGQHPTLTNIAQLETIAGELASRVNARF